jgi:predicted phage terminase large subunit-like protein
VAKNTSDVINIKGRSGKGFSLILRTAGGSSVGIHPNVIIVDDPLDQNDRDSQATRDGKEAWFDSLVPLLVPFHDVKTGVTFETIMYIGTNWHFRDLIWHILERNKILPASQKWDVERESICDESGKSNYPDFISDEKIAEIRAGISDIFFACQYMLNPLPENMQIFNLKKLAFVRPEQVDLTQGQICCFFDPSLGKTSSDFAAVWWTHSHNDTLTFIDAIDSKVELSLIVHQIAAKNQSYNCRTLIYENNGVTLIEQSLKNAHTRINYKIYMEGIHHSSNKKERIISTQPDLYSGRVQFMSDYLTRYPEAMNQIVFYGAYNYDDFPDCMEMAISYFRQKHFEFIRYESCL